MAEWQTQRIQNPPPTRREGSSPSFGTTASGASPADSAGPTPGPIRARSPAEPPVRAVGSDGPPQPGGADAGTGDAPSAATLARLAAKARVVEGLSSGDARILQAELVAELERLAGATAAVVSLSDARRRR